MRNLSGGEEDRNKEIASSSSSNFDSRFSQTFRNIQGYACLHFGYHIFIYDIHFPARTRRHMYITPISQFASVILPDLNSHLEILWEISNGLQFYIDDLYFGRDGLLLLLLFIFFYWIYLIADDELRWNFPLILKYCKIVVFLSNTAAKLGISESEKSEL